MSDKIILYDRIKERSYTTGSGNMVLEGAEAGFSSFSSVYSHGDAFFYAMTDGSSYEIGSGVLLRADFSEVDSIVNDEIQRFPIKTNTGSIVNWSTGLKEVYVTYPASHSVYTGSGVGGYLNPQSSGIALWGGSHTLNYDPSLTWNSETNSLGINNSNPSFAIDIGGSSAQSLIKASGYIVGESGIKFSAGVQNEHFIKNQLDKDAFDAGLIGENTGLNNIVELSGSVNQYILLKKQNAGLVLAGPPSGCGAPPCNPDFPSFRSITMDDLPPLSDLYVSYSNGTTNDGRIAIWTDDETVGSDQYFTWDSINHRLSIGKPGTPPIFDVEISGVLDVDGRVNVNSGIYLHPSNNISDGQNILYQNSNNELVFNNQSYVSSGGVDVIVSDAVSNFLINDLNLNVALSGKSFIPIGTIEYSEAPGSVQGELAMDNEYLYAYTPSGEWRRIYLGNSFDIRSFGDNSFQVPDAPTNLTGSSHNEAIHLQWTAPDSQLGIIDYIVEYSGVANSGWITYGSQGSEPRENVEGLVNGDTFYFRVAAVSVVGSGAYSNVFSAVPNPTVPFRPLITSVANNNIDSITVNWTTPEDGGSAITNYEIEYTKISGVAQTELVGAINTFTLDETHGIVGESSESPNGGAFYTVRVRAVNSIGSGDYSTPASLLVRSIGPPSPPTSAQLESVTFDSATLSFVLPDFAGHPGEPVSTLDYRALVRFTNFDNTALAVSGTFNSDTGFFYPVYLNSGTASASGTPMPIEMSDFDDITFYGVSNVTVSGQAAYPSEDYDLYNRYDQVVIDSPGADLRRNVTVTQLDRDTLYNITLRSFNNNFTSEDSNSVTANTTNPPLKPVDFFGFAESNSGIILNWTNPTQALPVIDHSLKIGTPSVFFLDFENFKDFDRGDTRDLTVYNSANLGSLPIYKLGTVTLDSDSAIGNNSLRLDGLTNFRGIYTETSKDFEFGLNDFTIECFIKCSNVNKESILFDFRKSGNNPDTEGLDGEYFLLRIKPNGRLEYRDSEAQRSGFVTESVLSNDTWHHIAFSRFGNVSKLFVDGSGVENGFSDNLKYLSSPFAFGYDTGSEDPAKNFLGKVDGIRVVNGVGLYKQNFTAPNYNFVDTQYKLDTDDYQSLSLDFESSTGIVGDAELNQIAKNGASGLFIPGNGSNGVFLPLDEELAFGLKDFTVETWIYPLALDNEYFLFDFRPTNKNSDPGGTYFLVTVNQNRGLNYYTDGKQRISTSGNLSLGQWNKVEISRSQSSTKIFVNGVTAGTLEVDRFNFLSQDFRLGFTAWNNRPDYVNQNFIGYIDDVRILKGIGLYTGNHTVATSYTTNVYAPSDYSSLIANFEEVVDDSLSIENSGNIVDASTTEKQFGTQSLFFPSGSNSNVLESETSSNLHFGKGDFTVEAWINPTAISGTTSLFDFRPDGINSLQINDSGVVDGTYLYVTLDNSGIVSYITDGITRIQSSVSSVPSGDWTHVAVSRKNNISRLFINGVQHSQSYIDDNNFQPQAFRFGNTGWSTSGALPYVGYVDFLKVSKFGHYTENFTPPNESFVEPTNNTDYPSISLNYNGNISDATNQSEVFVREGTSNGNVIKFGSSSLYMGVSPTSTLGIETDQSYLFAFGRNDFTVETWIYPTDLSVEQSIMDFREGNVNSTDRGTYFHLDISSDGEIRYKAGSNILSNAGSGTLTENNWQHVAVSRFGNISRVFVNGVQVGDDIIDNNNYLFSRFRIGPSTDPSKNYRGYIDETRVLNGRGIYTSDFTAPTLPFSIPQKKELTSLTTQSSSIGANSYHTVTGLEPRQEYVFKIAPESVAGVGEFSDLIKVETKPALVTTWNTANTNDDTSLNDEVQLPLLEDGTYNFYVSWGDGSFDLITNSNYIEKSKHEYDNPGQYTIKMQGQIDGWQFKDEGDAIKLQNVSSWGPLNLIDDIDRQFQGCSNLTVTASDYPSVGNTLNAAFADCVLLNDSLEDWDLSRCLDTDFMFLNCVAYNGDISKWDVSNVKSMRAMFLNAVSFNRDIGRWSTGKVFNMNSMLANASNFNQDISLMKIDSLVDANRMLIGTDISKQNYDKLLEFWGDLDTPKRSDVSFGISQEYTNNSAAATAREVLRDQYGWIINDFGSDNSFVIKIKSDTDDFVFNLGDFFKTNTNDSSRSYSAMYVNFGDESFQDISAGSESISKNYFDKLSQELELRIDGDVSNFNTKYNSSRQYIVDIARWGGVSNFVNNIPDRFSGCTNLISVTAEDAPNVANSIAGFFTDCELLGSVDDSEGSSNFILSFGLNVNGQLGYDTSRASNPFPRKSTNKRWRKVAVGKNHVLAIDNQGFLWSWGLNSNGQLGHGDNTTRITPARISNKTWTHIAAGRDHSLAIDNTGRLYAWGSNEYGQIGDNTNNNRLSPVIIDEIDSRWSSIAAGHDFSMAISEDGEVYCWGNNESGQLGLGDSTARDVPVKMGTKSWSAIDAGRDHALAIDDSDELYVWGNNSYGQLGLGDNNSRNTPTQLPNKTWKKISAGEFYSLAIDNQDKAYGWGNNAYGQLGNEQGSETGNKINAPYVIRNDLTFTQVYAGYRHSAAIQTNKSLWIWGDNTYGQLGYETEEIPNSLVPVKLNSLNEFGDIALGEYHTSSLLDEDPVSSTSLEDWNTTNVTDVSKMFAGCASFNVSLDDWDTSSIVNMSYMFSDAIAFNRSLNSWDTSSVLDMSHMFEGAISFDEDISSWDTYNVTNMSYMFNGATSFDKNIGFWDISSVKDMSFIFTGAVSLDEDTYSDILVGWATNQVQRNVTLHASSFYDGSSVSVLSSRNFLLSNDWTLNDLGATNV